MFPLKTGHSELFIMVQKAKIMDKIILQAMNNCSQKYAKGILRYFNLWDNKRTLEQKAFDIAEELKAGAYEIVKTKHEPAKE